MARRMETTSDPARLAQHLADSFRELADTAERLPQHEGNQQQLRRRLTALYHQAGNMTNVVDLARTCLDDSIRFSEPVEWEVAAEARRDATVE